MPSFQTHTTSPLWQNDWVVQKKKNQKNPHIKMWIPLFFWPEKKDTANMAKGEDLVRSGKGWSVKCECKLCRLIKKSSPLKYTCLPAALSLKLVRGHIIRNPVFLFFFPQASLLVRLLCITLKCTSTSSSFNREQVTSVIGTTWIDWMWLVSGNEVFGASSGGTPTKETSQIPKDRLMIERKP